MKVRYEFEASGNLIEAPVMEMGSLKKRLEDIPVKHEVLWKQKFQVNGARE